MQFFNGTSNINFMGQRKFAALLSIALVVTSIAMLIVKGLNFGIDFTGGTIIKVGYEKELTSEQVRTALSEGGFKDLSVQAFDSENEMLVRLAYDRKANVDELVAKVVSLIAPLDASAVSKSHEVVGPKYGAELTEQGAIAILFALGAILLYVVFRFEYRFAIGSVAALGHDVVLVLGFFALFQFQFDPSVFAALLAVIGYSLNDTIVVFDRIRENFISIRDKDAEGVINTSINATLSRTMMTSLTTLLVLLALYLRGGPSLEGFSLALIIGVIVGTYSSIYVASNVTLALGINREVMLPVEKEDPFMDEMP